MLGWLIVAFTAGILTLYARERSHPGTAASWLFLPGILTVCLVLLAYLWGVRDFLTFVLIFPAASAGGLAGGLLAYRARKRSGVRL